MRISDWSSDVCSSDLAQQADWLRVDHGVDGEAEAGLSQIAIEGAQPVGLLCGQSGPRDQAVERIVLARSEERRVGKEWSVRVDLGGRRIIKKKKHMTIHKIRTQQKHTNKVNIT